MESNQHQEDLFTDHASSVSAVQLAMYRQSLIKARNLLLYVGFVVLVMTVTMIRVSYKEFDLGIAIMAGFGGFMTASFVALALWVKTKPYTAIVTSMVASLVYLILILALFMWVFGTSGGISIAGSASLLPVVLIMMLSRYLRKAKEVQRSAR